MLTRTQRILSLILAIALFLTGIDLSVYGHASAERSVGSSNVSETPDNLLSMGEWLYWVLDGQAYVAGYTNFEEDALTIPYYLGGYPVVGIGKEAFSRNDGLRNVTIHTNVTAIADSAFPGLNGITISAYHGAYALDYAAENGLQVKNLSSVAEFADGVIDLTGLSRKAYSELSDFTVKFNKHEASFLKEGQVVYFPAQSGYSTGLAAKIVSITQEGEILNTIIDRPNEGTIFKRLQLEENVQLDWSQAQYFNGCEPISATDESFEVGVSHVINVNLPLSDRIEVSGKIGFEETLTVEVDVKWSGLWPTLESASVKEDRTTTLELSISAEDEDIHGLYKKEIDKDEIDKALAKVPIVSTGGISGFITVELVLSIKGELTLKKSVTTIQRWDFRNGEISHSVSKNHSVSVGVTGEIKSGPEIKFYLVIGFANIEAIRFFEISAGLYYKASASLTRTSISGTAQWHRCLEISHKVYFEFKVKFGIIKVGDLDLAVYCSLEKTFDIVNLGKAHVDVGQHDTIQDIANTLNGPGICYLKNRKAIFVYDNGQAPVERLFDVNDELFYNMTYTPYRAGYQFQGWYVDIEKSGLPSNYSPHIHSKSLMPYVYQDGTLYIRALWKDMYPVTSISIDKSSISGLSNTNTGVKICVTDIQPANANNKAVQWESSDTNVATVNNDGYVRLHNAGTATITCRSAEKPEVKATCAVTVNQSVTGIGLNTNNIFRYSNNMSGVQLTASVYPVNANNKSVTWSSNNTSVASVSDNGYITLNGIGTAEITCHSVSNPNVTASCIVAVRQAVTGISLNKKSELRTNADMSSLTLSATVSPSNAYNKALVWRTSNPSVATVSADGTVYMKGVGKTTITCASVSNPEVKATFDLEIIQAVTAITLNKKAVTLYSDEKNAVKLIPGIVPTNAGNHSVTWESSNTEVVKVSSVGEVTVVGAGDAVVICRSVSNPDVTAECPFTILQAVTSIELDTTSINTTNDEINPTYLHAAVYPANAHNKAVNWSSSNTNVASVTNDGIVTFRGVGEAVITCKSESTPYITAECTIKIVQAVTGMSLNEKSIVVYNNQKDNIQLIATLEARELSNREVKWTTNRANVATVSDSGIVTIKGLGTAVITCTSISNPNVSAQCQISVRQSVTEISLNQTEITRYSDNLGTVQLTASISPSTAANKDLRWSSSEPAVATVDDDGLVKLVGPGNAVITCTSVSDPEIGDTCSVTVYQAVNSLTLNYRQMTRYTSETGDLQLTAYAQPAYAKDKNVIWSSSDASVASVSINGFVTIRGAGNAVITCASTSRPEVTAKCSLTIKQAVTSITLNRDSLNVYNDQTSVVNLVATVSPANSVNKELVWSSSDTSVVHISDNGVLSIAGTGQAVITCTAVSNPYASASCTVTINETVQSIVLNETEIICYDDDIATYQLTANVQPNFTNNKEVNWKSSNTNVATVSPDGLVSITGIGNAFITCTSKAKPSVVAQCSITVKQPMTNIELNQAEIELFTDDDFGVQLTATVLPEHTDDQNLIWKSDSQNVAIVTDDGLVKAVGKGTANISVHSARRPSEIYAVCLVNVKQRITNIAITGDTDALLPKETVQLNATCSPVYADNTTVVWRSDNPNVASVDNNGMVTGISYGTATITATSTDGGNVTASFTVKVEHELALVTTIDESTLYAQGNRDTIFASVRLGNASARRMAEAGFDVTWSLAKLDQNDDVQMIVLSDVASDCNEDYDTTYIVLQGKTFETTGSKTYTVTCTAGLYSESVSVVVNIIDTEVTDCVTLNPSSFTMKIGDTVEIPTTPSSTGDKPVPSGIKISKIKGDQQFVKHGTWIPETDKYEVTFDKSGIYAATVSYVASNMVYDVNVTFYVQDENGLLHIPTENIDINESYLVLVEGTTHHLDYTATPVDAFDATVTWSSSDESVATVDQNGKILAISPGEATISCSANDGNGAAAICVVKVEKFLQLDDSELLYTIYTSGDHYADLGVVNVTLDSEKRLLEAGLNVTWTIEEIRGSACDITVEEFTADAEDGITFSGNLIKLLRINHAGTDTYRLTCLAGEYTDSCVITIHVLTFDLPSSINLNRTEYSGKINEPIIIDTAYTPAVLPEETMVRINGGYAFDNALASRYDFTEPERLVFETPGTYSADVLFTGDNYSYICPIIIVVCDEDGNVPINISELIVSPDTVNLLVGEEMALVCSVEPSNAEFSNVTWVSSDTSIATVSKTGTVTAISAGTAFITVSVSEYDYTGGCIVVVEDQLTIRQKSIERTVFVDGITRTQLDTVQLTAASSQRLPKAPEWSIRRMKGDNLTLKVKEHNTIDDNGNLIYGCSIILYSMSHNGDTEYELICKTDDNTVSIPVVVHAENRDRHLPSGLSLEQTTFTGTVGELIKVLPKVVCLPNDTALPDGMRVRMEGDALFEGSVNTSDYYVSQNTTTLSFTRAGVFEANFIYSYSNIRYVIPVTFRICDSNGMVPVLATAVSLSSRSLWMNVGEVTKLKAVFTPADTNNNAVTWMSTDPSVVTVDSDGSVSAITKGYAEIICKPSDSYLGTMICSVWVEDYLSIETGENHIRLYKQGDQINEVFSANLSQGTIARLSQNNIIPQWSVNRISGQSTEVVSTVSAQADSILINSTALVSGGTDIYRVTCVAGEQTQVFDFTIDVIDIQNAAESISLPETKKFASIGETITIDFTPICSPVGTSMPNDDSMWSLYAGIGQDFQNAVDRNVYSENANSVTMRFTKAGRFLFSRQYFLGNLHYEQVCEIVVGQSETSYNLLQASVKDSTVYIGGTAGVISEVSVTDSLMLDVFDQQMKWSLSRVSGDSLDMVLKNNGNGVQLLVVATNHTGKDVWRVTCEFGSYSESIDVCVNVEEPRSQVPDEIELSINHINGKTGDWLSMPIAVSCSPMGSDLPEMGDDFWYFQPLGQTADVSTWEIEDGVFRILFCSPGYYAGMLSYVAGSFKYSFPVYMAISDEEGILSAPALDVHLLNMPVSIYSEGQKDLVLGSAELTRGVGSYYAGEAAAYLNRHVGTWDVEITSGNAVALSVESDGKNSANIFLDSINGLGTVEFTVRCTVEGATYSQCGTLTVLDEATSVPDPSLKHSVYYAITGEPIDIPTTLYERSSGSILQGTTKWNPGALLPVIGYEYIETSDNLQMTFYKEGIYASTLNTQIGNLTYQLTFSVVVSHAPVVKNNIITPPKVLTTIDDYAFENIAADVVDLRNTNVISIGAWAFANCTDLATIYIPCSVKEIADNAFYGCLNITIVCSHGSIADEYAQRHNIPVRYE